MYLTSEGQLSYTLSIKRVVGGTMLKTLLVCYENSNIFWLHHAHVWKDTKSSFTLINFCTTSRGLGTRLCSVRFLFIFWISTYSCCAQIVLFNKFDITIVTVIPWMNL